MMSKSIESLSREKHISSEHAKQWYDYGCAAPDYIVKFMFFWIAFNWLYNQSDYYHCRSDFPHKYDDEEPSEREQILNLVDDVYEKIRTCTAPVAREILTFKKEAIINERTGRARREDYKMLCSTIERKRVYGLFLTLYQVRCNLFHGSKSAKPGGRDGEIVHAASVILKGYLDKILNEQ